MLPRVTARRDAMARLALGVGVPMLFIALAYVPYFLVRSDLPDRLASHFDMSGTPDGSMTVTSFLLVTGALLAVGLVLCVSTAIRRPAEASLASTAGFLGGFLGTLGAAILASTAVTQRGLDDWHEAGDAGWTLLFTLVSATAGGTLAAWLTTQINDPDTPAAAPVAPVMDLADGESAVWLASLRSVPLLLLGIATSIIGLILISTTNWVVGAAIILASIPLTALATLHVRADRSGLRITYGWLPWPSTHVALADIETAQVIDVRPREWGGWGYRGSLKLMRKAAVVHRAGPGIRLDLDNGKVFVVTIDDADTGVALLNALRQRCAALSPPIR
jgi:hypothetical protein